MNLIKKKITPIAIATMMLATAFAFTNASSPEKVSATTAVPRKSTEVVKDMGIGFNLGNTMEAMNTNWQPGTHTVRDYETCWGQPVTTKAMIDGLKQQGYNSVRIPVAWSNLMSQDGTYTISPDLLKRVDEIIGYVLDNDMYAVVNIHWDGNWWAFFGAENLDNVTAYNQTVWDTNFKNSKEKTPHLAALAKYEAIWKQLSEHYKNFSDKLIFESANEELGNKFGEEVCKTGEPSIQRKYEITNDLNQRFVNIVRNSGGNNANRFLLIAGYTTNIGQTCDERFKMPTDSVSNKLIISVHYYTPATFCLVTDPNNSWGYSAKWGTTEEIAEMQSEFEKMKKFVDNGYGVIIGEYGVTKINNNSTVKVGTEKFFSNVLKYSMEYGYCPMAWDCNDWYKRQAGDFELDTVRSVYQNRYDSIYKKLIDEAKAIENTDNKYEIEYYNALQDAIKNAEDIYAVSSTDRPSITTAMSAIRVAMSNLPLKQITSDMFTVSTSNLTYKGTAWTRAIKSNLKLGTDYKVSYKNNTNVGTATLTITGLNDYYGTITKTFKIVPKKLASSQFSLSTTKYGYTGTTKKPAVKSKLKLNKDYTVTYSSNLYVGTAKVTIKGKGNYTGTITKYFSIVKPTAPGAEKVTKLVAGKKTVTVTYAKKTGVKYKVLLSSNRSFKGARKVLTTKTSVKFTKLASGKKYYVKVCAYKTYKTSKTKAGYVYGKYSALKAIRAK